MTSTNRQAKPLDSVLAGVRRFGPESTKSSSRDAPLGQIVLIHGSMDRQAGFLRLARLLSTGSSSVDHTVVLYDRRGYASSSPLGGPFDIDQQVQDLLEVIGSIPSILIGHSFGGTVALACAHLHPDLVRGVVVYENPMPWLDWWPTDTGAGRAARHHHDPHGAAEAFLIRFIGQRVWDRLPQSTKDARRAEGHALVGELASIHARAAFDRDRITVPLMVGVGSLASDHMRRGAQYLAQATDARLVVLDGAHHNAHSANARDFVERLVTPIIDRLETGSWDRSL